MTPMHAVRWPCALVLAGAVALAPAAAAAATPTRVLFVGDSFTFGRVDPVMHFAAGTVHDLTAGFAAADPRGTHPWEPHPWGGVPALFKAMTVEAGLDWDVSISARNAASLRTHLLNAPGPAWDLRGNIASQRWDVVVLQEQSEAPLPRGRGAHADPARFAASADRLERFIHDGAPQQYGGRAIPANPNASPATKVFLIETWARPDRVFAHRRTVPDASSPVGAPRVAEGREAPLFHASLAAMTADLHAAYARVAATNPRFAGVIPVGDAMQAAVDDGLARWSGFGAAESAAARARPGAPIDLWWLDGLHAGKYGSYLGALVQFGMLTGRDPCSLGAADAVARDLGIASTDAVALQGVASRQLGVRNAGAQDRAAAASRRTREPRAARCAA